MYACIRPPPLQTPPTPTIHTHTDNHTPTLYPNPATTTGLTCTSGREVLAGRWRQPTLSINQVQAGVPYAVLIRLIVRALTVDQHTPITQNQVASSNPTDSYSILPKAAMAKVSVRTVPRQNPARCVVA